MDEKELRKQVEGYVDHAKWNVGFVPDPLDPKWKLNVKHETDQIMALIDSYSREARIDEISGVQLEYGHYVAQTFVNGKAMTILDRIAKLKALGAKPEGKPNE